MLPRSVLLTGIVVLAFMVPPASAQDDSAPPAHVSWVEGQVLVEREATREDLSGPTPLLPGERVRTEGGRAEVLFGDGTLLQLDEGTTIDVLSDSLVRLVDGRVMLVVGSGGAGRLQVDTPGGSVRPQTAGEYRLALVQDDGRPTLEVAAIRGSAEVVTDQGSTTVAAGQRAWAREGELPSYPATFNSAQWDAFDEWSQQRLSARRGVYSARHVPAALHSYAGVLDTHGYWAHQPTYGHVWFPRVAHGWRPYYHGRWRFYARFGWTWLGADVWAWPTHHYGRWGITSAGAWFWIPGRHWGPAWVHWAVAPGYVSWCPLGFDNRPVYAFWRPGHRSWAHARWAAWTVVPRRHFGAYVTVSRHALDGRHFASRGVQPTFIVQERSPGRSFAVAREAFVGEPRRSTVRRGTTGPAAASVGTGAEARRRGGLRAADVPATAPVRSRALSAPPPPDAPRTARTPSRAARPNDQARGDRRLRAGAVSATAGPGSEGASQARVRTAVPRRGRAPSAASAATPGAPTAAVRGRSGPAAPPATTTPPPAAVTPGAADAPPSRRMATPRSGSQPRVWSPEQVPVHRGRPPTRSPSRVDIPARTAPAREAGPPASSGATRSRRAAPPTSAPEPRGDDGADRRGGAPAYGSPRRSAPPPAYAPPSRGEGRATPRGTIRGGGSRSATPPPSAAPSSGPPPSAGPARSGRARQAPAGGGRGTAVRRGGGSPR